MQHINPNFMKMFKSGNFHVFSAVLQLAIHDSIDSISTAIRHNCNIELQPHLKKKSICYVNLLLTAALHCLCWGWREA